MSESFFFQLFSFTRRIEMRTGFSVLLPFEPWMAHKNARFVPFETIEEEYLSPLAPEEERKEKVKSHLQNLEKRGLQKKKKVRRLNKKERKEIKKGFLQKAKRLRMEREQGRRKTLKLKV